MFASATWAKVERQDRRSAVGPDVGPMGFLFARRKHLHGRFISLNHALLQHRFTQRIDQRPELHVSLPNPLGYGRESDCQLDAAKNFLLPVQRQVIGKLGHHYVDQQAWSRDTCVGSLLQAGSVRQGPKQQAQKNHPGGGFYVLSHIPRRNQLPC